MSETFNIEMTKDDIALACKALANYLANQLQEWEQKERSGEADAAASLYMSADQVRVLMNKIGAAPLKLR